MYLEDIKEVIKIELLVDLDEQNTRKQNIVDARRIFCDLARQLNIFSFAEIGKSINRVHCSVIHLCNTSESLRETDKDYREKYERVFEKTIKINTDEMVKKKYSYYKKMHYKYRDLLKEIKDYEKNKLETI